MKALLILVGSFTAGLIMKSETPAVMRAALADSPPAAGAKKSDSAKKAASAAKVEGMEVPRKDGGYLGVAIVGNTFRITFYDSKKKAIPADVSRALLRWDPKTKPGSERLVLNRTEDGQALASPRNVRPPYQFKLFITLLKSGAEGDAVESAGETFAIDFRA